MDRTYNNRPNNNNNRFNNRNDRGGFRSNNRNGGHRQIQWNQIEDFTENGITVRVNQAQYRYSIIIGRKDFNDRFRIIPFIPVPVVGLQEPNSVLQFEVDYAATIHNLIRKAQDFILQRENRYRDENAPRDEEFDCNCTDDCPDSCDCGCHYDDEDDEDDDEDDEKAVAPAQPAPRRTRSAG